MKGECNVARDLMPLCIDGAASEESKAYVDSHVSECEPCRAVYEGMKGSLSDRLAQQAAEEGEAFARGAARLRRRRRLRRILTGVLAGVLAAALIVGLIVVYNMDFRMPASKYDVTLSRLENGSVVVTMRTKRKIETGGISWGTGPYYLDGETSSLKGNCWFIDWYGYRLDHRADQYGVMATRKDGAEMESFDCIACGAGQGIEGASIVWRAGDEIAPASPEMEDSFAACEAYYRYCREVEKTHLIEQIENDDYRGYHSNTDEEIARMEELWNDAVELRKAVPEWGAGEKDVEVRGVVG